MVAVHKADGQAQLASLSQSPLSLPSHRIHSSNLAAQSPADFAFTLNSDKLVITATPSSVRLPRLDPALLASLATVDIRVVLEPAYFGFLPASCLPLIVTIVGILLVLYLADLPGRAMRVIDVLADGVARERQADKGR